MADFLSNLVAKNLNLAPVLEPRLLSLYEPWQRPAARELPSHSGDAPFEVSLERDALAPSPRPRGRDSIESPHPEPNPRGPNSKADAPLRHVRRSDIPAVEARVISAQAVRLPRAESPSVREPNTRLAEREIDIRHPSLKPRIEPAPTTETLRVERVIVEQERTNAAGAFSNLVARDRVAGESALRGPPMTPLRESVSSKRKVAKFDSRAAPPPMLLPRPFPPLTPTKYAEPAPETINVTIGRIEVRSVTARPTPKAPCAPQLSTLEDYLRGSGKR